MTLTLATPFIPGIKLTRNKSEKLLRCANHNSLSAVTKPHRYGDPKPLNRPQVPGGGVRRWTCRKHGVHPEFFEDSKVYCNGELVMTTGGTQKEYTVDVWSGNHPFYLGNRNAVIMDDNQVEKFRRRYGELADLMEIPVLKGEIVLPERKKRAAKDKGKK
ncbi:hypothetical protein HPP92_009679 [Vanilla planifolia]|uniref:Large ribosomal subunit protein bL31c n=1 Tax=Vanilla planifolia TaxID=51239 RepID=A0A835R503_VANPL|nr:hypothetical protein HPP92_009679 [Vanilla planifolia]